MQVKKAGTETLTPKEIEEIVDTVYNFVMSALKWQN